ncbi:MAG: phage holin family protein [Jiangellaceae bacterium]|nr:phage holin family protein [Jiangellaceae bacterium]
MTDTPRASGPLEDASLSDLVRRLGDQLTTLVRDELRLAQAEVQAKGKRAGIGAGLFGGAGTLVFYGVGALIAAATLALSLALEPWLAALIVGAVLLAAGGVLGLMGKRKVQEALPPVPQEAVSSVKQDIAVVKEPVVKEHGSG